MSGWRTMRRVALVTALGTIGIAALAATLVWRTAATLPPLSLDRATAVSTVVLDRHDRLLRAFQTPDQKWRLPVEVADVDPRYLALLAAFEDRRFERHAGVDPWALIRAGTQVFRHGRIVSGASTLTMQVARLLEPDAIGNGQRSAAIKLRQMIRAVEIERRFSKREILALYLRLAPFGGNLEGARAASLAYFGKEPKRLSVAEAALLVALPQAPSTRRPDRFPLAARRARDRVLTIGVAAGVITPAEADRARRDCVPTTRRVFPMLAPHLAEAEAAARPSERVHRVTIDRDLQSSLETLAREHARGVGLGLSAAVLVADHRTGDILAYVGASDYLDRDRRGAVDMITATRSPGSTLKPFIYGLGFEAGLMHPSTLIEDRPVRFGTYAPKNFDDEFHGTVTVRSALQQSLNVPAIKVLAAVGPGRLLARLRRAGTVPQLPTGAVAMAEPTLAVGLGGLGLSVRDLATLYAALARGGEPVGLVHVRSPDEARPVPGEPKASSLRHVLTPAAAWYVTDILKDAPPPVHAAPGRFAYKTGTSYGYRDAWAVGYDGRHVVAAWVGRPDGASTPGLAGRAAAAPLLFDAMQRLGVDRAPFAPRPAGVVEATGAELPPPLKRFREPGDDAGADRSAAPAVAIAFPPDRAELEIDGAITLKAEHGVLPLTWLADGRPIAADPNRREATLEPDGAGTIRVTVIDALGRADRVTVRVR